MGITVAVAGASGYAGGELLRLLAGHPAVELAALTASESSVGTTVADLHPQLVSLADRVLEPTTTEVLAAADVVMLALPHGTSAAVADRLPPTVRVIDLGADHRLHSSASWERYYGGHPAADPWPYALPELPGARAAVSAASRVAVPGCHATAVILGLAPLVAAGLVEPDDIVTVSISGTSGAGAAPSRRLLGSEVMGDLTPYKVGRHQHTAEIAQALGVPTLSFTPVLAPLPRGILATSTARLRTGVTASQLRGALEDAYGDEPFVHLLSGDRWPHTGATAGTNAAHLQVTTDPDAGRAVVCCALDNLGKGAAGQAVQVLNLMLGLDESTGLTVDGVAP